MRVSISKICPVQCEKSYLLLQRTPEQTAEKLANELSKFCSGAFADLRALTQSEEGVELSRAGLKQLHSPLTPQIVEVTSCTRSSRLWTDANLVQATTVIQPFNTGVNETLTQYNVIIEVKVLPHRVLGFKEPGKIA